MGANPRPPPCRTEQLITMSPAMSCPEGDTEKVLEEEGSARDRTVTTQQESQCMSCPVPSVHVLVVSRVEE